tara:strand:- start:282 stop:821 length:540 start_codon:yes stop_codon:yes gene_type:complete
METKNIERYLESFGRQVANRAKGNLQRKKGGGTKLEKSIEFEVVKEKDGYSVQFYMNDYGTFLDKGVSGNKQSQSFKEYTGTVKTSPYKYTTRQPPPDILARWISKKGIKGRDKKTGRFISNMNLAFIIGKKIKRDGIESLAFFQKPLGLGLKEFNSDFLQNVKEDIIEELEKSKITIS